MKVSVDILRIIYSFCDFYTLLQSRCSSKLTKIMIDCDALLWSWRLHSPLEKIRDLNKDFSYMFQVEYLLLSGAFNELEGFAKEKELKLPYPSPFPNEYDFEKVEEAELSHLSIGTLLCTSRDSQEIKHAIIVAKVGEDWKNWAIISLDPPSIETQLMRDWWNASTMQHVVRMRDDSGQKAVDIATKMISCKFNYCHPLALGVYAATGKFIQVIGNEMSVYSKRSGGATISITPTVDEE